MSRPAGDMVVVIEDDPRLSAALQVLVRYWGYRCLVARTPREALETCGAGIRDVCAIIVDIEIDAVARAQRSARIFADAAGRHVPTLLTTTADGGRADQGSGLAVLAKPFDPDLVRQWLARQSVGRESDQLRAQG